MAGCRKGKGQEKKHTTQQTCFPANQMKVMVCTHHDSFGKFKNQLKRRLSSDLLHIRCRVNVWMFENELFYNEC